uniref:Titin n=1 Tax=Kryptolebias marmoratus TaxID=37003 RepID=A0A3Q3B710_KRYMA
MFLLFSVLTEPPTIELDFRDKIIIRVGESCLLQGRYTGKPAPSITWYRDDEELKADKHIMFKNTPITMSLGLMKSKREHSGRYVVVVENSTGSRKGVSNIIVVELLLDANMARDHLAMLGTDITLSATIKGIPTPTVSWKKNDGDVPSHITVAVTATGSKMFIPKCVRVDSGNYTITAENAAGKKSATCHVKLENLTTLLVFCFLSVPPTIEVDVKLIEGVVVKAGSAIALPAKMAGIPLPTARWMSDGKEILSEGRYCIDTAGSSTILSIPECQRGDTGEYILTVSNPVGSKTVALHVTVLDLPGPPIGPVNILEVTPDHMMIQWRAPKDDGGTPITNYVVEKKDVKKPWEPWSVVSSSFPECSDITENAVTVEWALPEYDGGSPISGYVVERREMTGKWIRVNKTPVLDLRYRVSGLFEGNSYEFRVFAENIAGISEPSLTSDPIKATRAMTKPGPPSNLKLKDWSKSYADICWTKPTRDGGSPVLGYVVEAQKSGTAQWDRINKDLIKICAYRVPGLIEGMEYRIRIRATNRVGDSEPRELPETILAKDILVTVLWLAG